MNGQFGHSVFLTAWIRLQTSSDISFFQTPASKSLKTSSTFANSSTLSMNSSPWFESNSSRGSAANRLMALSDIGFLYAARMNRQSPSGSLVGISMTFSIAQKKLSCSTELRTASAATIHASTSSSNSGSVVIFYPQSLGDGVMIIKVEPAACLANELRLKGRIHLSNWLDVVHLTGTLK